MTVNHSHSPLVLPALPALLFVTPTASASIMHRSLPWEVTRDWMPATSDGEESTALKQTCRYCLTHTVHKDTAMYKLAHK